MSKRSQFDSEHSHVENVHSLNLMCMLSSENLYL